MSADKTPEETPEVTPEETPEEITEETKQEAAEEAPAEAVAAAEPAAEEPAPAAGKKEKKAKKEKAPKGDKPKKKRGWIKWVALAIIVFIIMFIPFWFTRDSSACGQCHSMDKYYASWKKSTHGTFTEVPCMDCHVKPGVIGQNLYRFLFYREIFAEIVGMDLKPWGATAPGESSCARDGCHSLNRLSSTAGDIKISHAVHVKIVEKKYGKACSYCHAGASHSGIKGIGLQLPPRKQCFEAGCHKGQGKECDKCHTVKYKPGSVTKVPHE
jgi:nitrate/TMAO reductase-like tetraheme cytochrome c subunit